MNRKNVKYNIKSTIIDYSKSICVALIVGVFIRSFIFESTLVSGQSMMPTFNHKDRLIVFKAPYKLNLKEFNREDIVVFKAPDKDALYIKRIIGLPGDVIKIEDGNVYVNEKIIEEDYIKKDAYTYSENEGKNTIVKNGQLFVLGDNRDLGASKDSRLLGTISEKSVKGKVEVRFFPFNSIRRF